MRVIFESPRRSDPMGLLTAKERDVLGMVAEGHSNDRIFAKVGLAADPATHRRVVAVLAHLRAIGSPPV